MSKGLEWVLDARWREGHAGIMRHFQMIATSESVKSVISKFVQVEREPEIEDLYLRNGQ